MSANSCCKRTNFVGLFVFANWCYVAAVLHFLLLCLNTEFPQRNRECVRLLLTDSVRVWLDQTLTESIKSSRTHSLWELNVKAHVLQQSKHLCPVTRIVQVEQVVDWKQLKQPIRHITGMTYLTSVTTTKTLLMLLSSFRNTTVDGSLPHVVRSSFSSSDRLSWHKQPSTWTASNSWWHQSHEATFYARKCKTTKEFTTIEKTGSVTVCQNFENKGLMGNHVI